MMCLSQVKVSSGLFSERKFWRGREVWAKTSSDQEWAGGAQSFLLLYSWLIHPRRSRIRESNWNVRRCRIDDAASKVHIGRRWEREGERCCEKWEGDMWMYAHSILLPYKAESDLIFIELWAKTYPNYYFHYIHISRTFSRNIFDEQEEMSHENSAPSDFELWIVETWDIWYYF